MTSAQPAFESRNDPTALESEWTTLINGRSYHYVTAGPPDAPALVFLHGFADSWKGAELLMPRLRAHFRIFALDQRGHGESDRDFDRLSIDDFAADGVDFIERVIGRSVTLVGHCLGSLVAQRIAASEARLVDRLVLIGAGDSAFDNSAISALSRLVGTDTRRVSEEVARSFRELTLFRSLPPAILDICVRETQRVTSVVWKKVSLAVIEDDRTVAVQIEAPTLILSGDGDRIFGRDAQLRLSAALRQHKLISYPAVGHAPNWEIPEQVAQDILSFCWQ